MSQAIANPDELRRFRRCAKKFNGGFFFFFFFFLMDQMAALSTQLDGLNATADQENQNGGISSQLQMMNAFIESNNEYIPFLLRKADRLDEYLQQR
ncbi:MAG: hypothetical protein U0872_00415 [Planctomycetaceae bacterium]